MNFEHTEDRRMLADTLDRFIARAVRLRDARPDRQVGRRATAPSCGSQFAELGVIGALFSEADGGFGGSGFDIAVVFEPLGRGLVVEPFLGARCWPAARSPPRAAQSSGAAGRDHRRHAHRGASRTSEPDAHYELAHVQTRAERAGRGLGARRRQGGGAARRGRPMCSSSRARTAGAVDDEAGISLFLVPAGAAGLAARLPAHRRRPRGRAALAGRARSAPTRCSGRRAPATRCSSTRSARACSRCAPKPRRDGRGQGGDARIPAHPQAVRRADRQLPGAAAPHGRPAARDRAGALGGDQRRRRARRRPHERASARCRRPSTPSAASARWWPRKASRCTAASA